MANKTYCGELTNPVILRKLFFIAGCIAFPLISGCATSKGGNKFDTSQVSKIQTGKSNKNDVLSLMGAPYNKNSTSDGISTWSYHYQVADVQLTALSFVPILSIYKGGKTDVNAQDLNITFNKAGLVETCMYITYSRKNEGTGVMNSSAGSTESEQMKCEDVK